VKELNSADPSLKRVGEIIAEDLTMTAKVLQLVNSAFFGIPRKVSTAQQAVTLLGLNTIKALTLQVELFSAHQNRNDAVMTDLLNHSLKVGNMAKAISLSEKRNARQADAALVGGILHDIGKVLIYMLPEYRDQLAAAPVQNHLAWLDMEYRLFGTSHAEIGAYLLGLWGFTEDVLEMVAFHHCPGMSMDKEFSALTAVHIANALVGGRESGDEYSAWLDVEYLESLNVLGHLNDWADLGARFEQAESHEE
jgi:putative nucleotidyltransferase with HDIG domain